MSNLASFSVINQKVEKIFTEEKCESKGLAFGKLCLRTILKINDDEIEEAITDGPMDGEVDAIYISDRLIHIFTFKYTDTFEFTKKNYPESEIDQFTLTIDSVISGSLDKKTINAAVWDKYEEISNLASRGKIEFKIYIVSNKLNPVPHSKLKIENAIDKFRIVDKPIYYDQEDIVSLILQNKTNKINGKVKFIDKQYFEKSDGGIRTLIGAVSAGDIIDLIKVDEKDLINEQVFNENVRVYKPNHRVNKAIIESASDNTNYQFFYLNNGITILCEEAEYIPNTRSPIVELVNLQIINGGQTSHSLFEVYKKLPDKLPSIEILVRICETKRSNPISDKISETTNSQIPVGNRDLHSNDLIQKKLEEQFATIGYYYERKPNQYSEKPQSKVLNNELLAQLYMAYNLDMPSEAKNNKARVFNDLYDLIFDEYITDANEFLRLYNLYVPLANLKTDIQKRKRKNSMIKDDEAFILHATFHILNGIKILFQPEIDKISALDISAKTKQDQVNKLYKSKTKEFQERAISLINEIVREQMDLQRAHYSHEQFFKEASTNGIIKTHFLKTLNSN
ncbi:MAG: AIPR family protein [Sphingobacteriales bacterium]